MSAFGMTKLQGYTRACGWCVAVNLSTLAQIAYQHVINDKLKYHKRGCARMPGYSRSTTAYKPFVGVLHCKPQQRKSFAHPEGPASG